MRPPMKCEGQINNNWLSELASFGKLDVATALQKADTSDNKRVATFILTKGTPSTKSKNCRENELIAFERRSGRTLIKEVLPEISLRMCLRVLAREQEVGSTWATRWPCVSCGSSEWPPMKGWPDVTRNPRRVVGLRGFYA